MITNILLIVLLFGLAILVHEFGHFIVARLFGIKVLRFSIGFPPRLFGFTRGDTEYMIGAIPFGGYVKLSGEEWMETGKIEPHDLMAKPWWARIIVYSAGVTMNVVFAFVLFFGGLLRGLEIPNYSTILGEVPQNSEASRAGLRSGDKVVAVDGQAVESWYEMAAILDQAGMDKRVTLEVRRGDAVMATPLTLTDNLGLRPLIEPVIGEVRPLSPAQKAKLQRGDEIFSINGERVTRWSDVSHLIGGGKEEPITLGIRRGEERLEVMVKPKFDQELNKPVIGISPLAPEQFLRRFSVPEAAQGAAQEIWFISEKIVETLWNVITGKQKFREVLGGPVLIAQIGYAKAKAGIWDLLHFIGVLNVTLMVINLLPIPVLDGGMILLAVCEGIQRRRLSPKTYSVLTTAGGVFVLALILFATYNDVLRFLR